MIEPLDDNNIIGLSPGPWDSGDNADWPRYGYDGYLHAADWDWEASSYRGDFGPSGHSREEWLALADVMIARWTAWREFIAHLPPDGAA